MVLAHYSPCFWFLILAVQIFTIAGMYHSYYLMVCTCLHILQFGRHWLSKRYTIFKLWLIKKNRIILKKLPYFFGPVIHYLFSAAINQCQYCWLLFLQDQSYHFWDLHMIIVHAYAGQNIILNHLMLTLFSLYLRCFGSLGTEKNCFGSSQSFIFFIYPMYLRGISMIWNSVGADIFSY